MRGPEGAAAGKAPPRRPTRGRRGAAMGRGGSRGGGKEAVRDGREHNPWVWGETLADARPPEWTPIPTEWIGRRGYARPPEWRKTPGGAAKEWGAGSNHLRTTRPATERAGGLNCPRTTRPPTEGKGESNHGRMTRLQNKTEGELSCHRTTRPQEKMGYPGETKPWEPPQRPDPDVGRTDGGGGEGTKTHPPPKPPGSNRPMAETARRDEARL